MSNASFRNYRSLAKTQYTQWWPFQLNPSAEAVWLVLPKKEALRLKHLAIRMLLQQPVPKALQGLAEGPCLDQQGCQNIKNGGISHPGLVRMLSLSGDPEEQQHWRALIHHLLLPAETCKLHSSVFFFFLIIITLTRVSGKVKGQVWSFLSYSPEGVCCLNSWESSSSSLYRQGLSSA